MNNRDKPTLRAEKGTMKKWRTKDGKHLDVSLMETSHIKNILRGFDVGKCFGAVSLVDDGMHEPAVLDNRSEWRAIFEKELAFRELASDTEYYNEYPDRI